MSEGGRETDSCFLYAVCGVQWPIVHFSSIVYTFLWGLPFKSFSFFLFFILSFALLPTTGSNRVNANCHKSSHVPIRQPLTLRRHCTKSFFAKTPQQHSKEEWIALDLKGWNKKKKLGQHINIIEENKWPTTIETVVQGENSPGFLFVPLIPTVSNDFDFTDFPIYRGLLRKSFELEKWSNKQRINEINKKQQQQQQVEMKNLVVWRKQICISIIYQWLFILHKIVIYYLSPTINLYTLIQIHTKAIQISKHWNLHSDPWNIINS